MVDKKILLGLLMIPVAFALSTPFAILDYKTFIEYLEYQRKVYRFGHYGAESDVVSYGCYFMSLVTKYGVIQLILTGLGVLFLWVRDKSKTIFLICFPLSYFLFMGAYKVYFDRNIVVLIPFLALLGGYAFSTTLDYLKKDEVRKKIKKCRYLAYILLIILTGLGVYQQSYKALMHIRKITLPDTRWVSKIWVEKNIPRGSTIGREEYTPPVKSRYHRIVYLGFLALTKYKVDQFDYIVLSSYAYDRFLTDEERYPRHAQKYKDFFSEYELIKEFIPDNKNIGGPVIKIYKIR
jgi:hypothetical protein